MKDVCGLYVQQYRIFKPYTLPYELARTIFGTQFIRQVFGFAEATTDPLGEVSFRHGALKTGEDAAAPSVAIEGLQINDRRVVVSVNGSSRDATLVFMRLLALFKEMDPGCAEGCSAPLVFTQETSCVVSLDIDWAALLPRPLVSFANNELMRAASHPQSKATPSAAKAIIGVTFDHADPFLRDNAITYAPKEFSIEPEPKVPLSERRFLVRSPTPSDVHLELIERLERALIAGRAVPERTRERIPS